MKRYSKTFATLLPIVITLSPLVMAQVQVQQVQVQQNIGFPFGGDPLELEAAMRIEIDSIRRVTGLNETTLKKLEVAGMAAVKNAVKKSQEVKFAFPGINEAGPPQSGTTLSDEDAERSEKNNKNAQDQPFPFPQMKMLDLKKVKEEAIWVKTFASALNAEQLQMVDKYLAERSKHRRDSAVATKVNELDDALAFTSEQRKLVSALVDRKCGDALANAPRPAGMFGGGQVVVMMAGQQPSDLNAEDLKPILSEVQLVEFKRRQDLAAQGPFGALQRVLPPAVNAQLGLAPPTQSSIGFSYLEKEQSIEVISVEDSSEASRIGLQVGDLVDEVQGNPIDTAIQLKRAINKRGNEPLKMRVKRGGKTVELQGEAP
jgi:hypothetical protein